MLTTLTTVIKPQAERIQGHHARRTRQCNAHSASRGQRHSTNRYGR